jgi:hypothetical protein
MFSQKVGNELRTYKWFKEVFETEMYLSKNIPSRYRSAFAKFRCGVALLRLTSLNNLSRKSACKGQSNKTCFSSSI